MFATDEADPSSGAEDCAESGKMTPIIAIKVMKI
jgi:hypothetical protein